MAFAGLLKEADITAALAACQGNSHLPGTGRSRIGGFIAGAVTESHKQSIFYSLSASNTRGAFQT